MTIDQILSTSVLDSISTFRLVFDDSPCVAIGTGVRAEATLLLDTGDMMRVRVTMPFAAYSAIAARTSDACDTAPLTSDEVFAIEVLGDLDPESGDFHMIEIRGDERLWRGHDGRLHVYS